MLTRIRSSAYVRTWPKVALWALGAMVALTVGFGTYVVHQFRSYDLMTTFAYMETAGPLRPLFRHNLYALHPTPSEVLELNRRAGASIVLGMKDKTEQEALLSHLIAAGVDINARDERSSFTALHMAVSGGPSDVSLLLAHGARADLKDARGATPLDGALLLQQRFFSPERAEAIKLLQATQ